MFTVDADFKQPETYPRGQIIYLSTAVHLGTAELYQTGTGTGTVGTTPSRNSYGTVRYGTDICTKYVQ